MRSPWLPRLLIAGFLLICVWFSLNQPQVMLAPGPVQTAHHELASDCLSCHRPGWGVPASKCQRCHALAEIGVKTSLGVPLPPGQDPPFHTDLQQQNCQQCHVEHQGSRVYRTGQSFSHTLLKPAIQENCARCHRKPADDTHRLVKNDCIACHRPFKWQPASFDHQRLAASVQKDCASCHQKPSDSLHRQVKDNCIDCHQPFRWKPASFDHDKFFRFDRHHRARCSLCHLNDDYSQYSCYQCHAHTPARMRKKHLKEGIREIQNCAECHRSGDEDEARRPQQR